MEIEKEVNKQFKVFHKQIDMFDYQKKSLPNGRCFSFEIPNSHMSMGVRKFFVAELDSFWFWYKNVFREPRHFYEIIQEGLPCRLYFDLEFYKADNPDLNEEKVLSEFLRFVSSMIKEIYQIEITEKSFLLLDSTTDLKFSVHAIVHFPNNFLFPNNISMKVFIAKLIERMSETGIGIVKKENQETSICDPSVYTKNRNFRIFLSSKFNKNAIFKYRKGCKFYDELPNEREIFFDSLIIPPDFSKCPILNVIENKGIVLKRNRIIHTGAAQTSKPISSDSAEIKFDAENFDSGIPPSPLPELDEYVREFNSQYGRNVEIRSWNLLRVYSTKSLRVQYQLNNCKYCLRIKREHASNNVYWTCHLDREWMYQKCFDYDCRDFISDFFPLPSELMEQIKPKLDAIFFSKAHAAVTKLLPAIDSSTTKFELPVAQKKLQDNFDEKHVDHKIEGIIFKYPEERKRIQINEFKISPPKIIEKVENLFFEKKDEIIIEEKIPNINKYYSSTSENIVAEKKDTVFEKFIDLIESGKEAGTVSSSSKLTPKTPKFSTSKTLSGMEKLFESEKKSKVEVSTNDIFFEKPLIKRSVTLLEIENTINDDENESKNNEISSTPKRRKKE